MHGNRDFLIGSEFEKKTGAVLLDDPTVIEISGNIVTGKQIGRAHV